MLAELLILVCFHSILADRVSKPSYDVNNYEVVGHHFEKFIIHHNRQYDDTEKTIRFQNFIENLKEINTLNEKHPLTTFALIESRYWQIGKKVILSEQQMLDCDKYGSNCTDGGFETWGVSEVIKNGGQESEEDYPYHATYGRRCKFNKNKVVAKVSNCSVYSLSSEDALKELLYKEGPLSIALDSKNWFSFKEGIHDGCGCVELNHAVLLVGYGTENGNDFWVIKNSWGEKWGDKGFFRISRGKNCGCIGSKDPNTKLSAKIIA